MTRYTIILRLAWRNLWRNHRRTLIMLAAITSGAWAMIFLTSLTRGMVDDMVRDGIRALPGHVQIHHPRYGDDPTVNNSIAPPGRELSEVLDSSDVAAWTTRLKVPAVISSERSTRGVTLVGIDPEREPGLSFIAEDLSEGRFLESNEDSGLIVGARLLERLETTLGKRVVVMTQDPQNEIADRGFRVVGVFDSRLDAFEDGFVFAALGTLQQLLAIGELVSEVAVLGSDYRELGGLDQRIAAVAGEVKGNITARRKITLEPTAVVNGNLCTPGIVIQEGAKLEGRIVIGSEEAPAKAAKPVAKEAKEPPRAEPRPNPAESAPERPSKPAAPRPHAEPCAPWARPRWRPASIRSCSTRTRRGRSSGWSPTACSETRSTASAATWPSAWAMPLRPRA